VGVTSPRTTARTFAVRVRRFRASTFGPASEEPYRRRTSDWIRIAVAAALLFVAARHAGATSATEQAIFDFFNTLPGWLLPLFRNLYRLGALWAVGLVVASALVGRRWRLARDLLLAGVLAWGFGRLLGVMVVEGGSLAHGLRAVSRLGGSPAFPSVRLAVLVAVMRAAVPYVTRPTRRIGRLVIVGCALAPLYLGNAYPMDVFAGLVLGWAIAATVHVVFGSPGGRPTSEQVRRSLAELGIDADDVQLAAHQPTGYTLMSAKDDLGPLRIKVIGRDEADAQFLAKFWRFIIYRDPGPRLALTRLQQVEHEAYLQLVAREHGVQVPRVVAAGTAGPRAALLVQRPVGGVPLRELDAEAIDDDLLARVWEQVERLHGAHVVHGRLDADHVLIAADGPYLVGFVAGSSSGLAQHAATDVAQLLAATAGLVGDERAARAAAYAFGWERIAAALPWLQPSVLTRETRQHLGAGPGTVRTRLNRLRDTTGDTLGVETPELVQLQRVSGTNLALAVGTLVAAAVLLIDVGDPTDVWSTLQHANWSWLALAMILSLASNIGFAMGLQGTVAMRLPIWPTTELQVAMSFSNLAVPGIGGTGMQVRYLQKQGVDLSSAVASGGLLSTIGNLAAAVVLFGLALAIEPAHVNLSLLPTSGLAELTLATAAVVGVAAAVVGGIPRIRRGVMPPVMRAVSTMWAALRSPGKVALLLGGNVLATLLAAWCLVACLVAFGGHVSFWPLLAANVGVVTVASIVPIPGGGSAVGTVGLTAVLVAFGVREDIAVATVLTNQLIYFYLPAIPGWFATRDLARHDFL
jgi:glycosyltransferase 2 family protein